LKIPSFAKINLGLEVLRRRPDGYHDIRTLFQWIDYYDTIEFRPLSGPEIRLSGNDPSIPWDETNLVHRAASLLREKAGLVPGVDIVVEKRIPAGGGLGGGSSNAAMTLWGLNVFWRLGLSDAELEVLGLTLGMDVPYFFSGGLCLGEDRGDRLTTLPDLPTCWIVLAMPPFPVSTKLIYGSLDQAALTATKAPGLPALIASRVRTAKPGGISAVLAHGFRPRASGEPKARPLTSDDKDSRMTRFLRTRELVSLTNTLEETIFRFFPQLHEIKGFFRDRGAALSLVTGSGAGVFGLFEDRNRAERCLTALNGRIKAVLVETMGRTRGWDAITAGASPSGKAAGFGPAIRGFESSRPSSGINAPSARDKRKRP
jgi:4-diphosphocytidyl-2-C-methyl-D-erythritol kinase